MINWIKKYLRYNDKPEKGARGELNIGIHRGFVNKLNSTRSIAFTRSDASTTTPILTLAGVIVRFIEVFRRVNLLIEPIVVDSELCRDLPEYILNLIQPVYLDHGDSHRFRMRSQAR